MSAMYAVVAAFVARAAVKVFALSEGGNWM